MTVGEMILALKALDPNAKVLAFSPFDPNGPEDWEEPAVSVANDGSVHIEPNWEKL